MAWVVDTCLLIDIAEDDPKFGGSSAKLLDSKARGGLLTCPITYAELSPIFDGEVDLQNEFMGGIGIQWQEAWTWQDTKTSHAAWGTYVMKKRLGGIPKRPIADILIGAFASRFEGLLTRNPQDFASVFPNLKLVSK